MVILPVLRHLTSDRDAVVAGVISGPLTMLPALLFFIPMVAFYPEVQSATLPSDYLLQRIGIPAFHLLFQAMIFSALLESGTSAVHAINERIDHAWKARRGQRLSHRARLTIALVLLVGCMFLASRFGLVALIANGYRALAYILLAVFVLPLLTVGVWHLRRAAPSNAGRSARPRPHQEEIHAEAPVRVACAWSPRSLRRCSRPRRCAAPPAGFEQRVEQLRTAIWRARRIDRDCREWPDRRLRAAGACGTIGTTQPVDADTIFATGSTGKAFTVAALAMLVDQGKIKWDDKVIDHMPDFRMWDPWVTREMTIRDLLVHRSGLGLGAGDLLFVPNSDLSRKEMVRRLRHIKPATSFRSAYAYDNILYMVAGQLIEEVSGTHLGAVRPAARSSAARHEQFDRVGRGVPGNREPRASRTAAPTGRSSAWARKSRSMRARRSPPTRRPRAGLRSAPTT